MKCRQIAIIGAGGHGRVVADIARLCGYDSILFFDDQELPGRAGTVGDVDAYLNASDVFVAIGNNTVRKNITERLAKKPVTLIHPQAVVARDVELGCGVVVMAGAVINPGAKIGDGVIINTCSSVDHDCTVGAYTHISVGAHLAGTVHIGKSGFICAGAVVINNTCVCNHVIVGAGAVVVKDITEAGTYIGIPARKQT